MLDLSKLSRSDVDPFLALCVASFWRPDARNSMSRRLQLAIFAKIDRKGVKTGELATATPKKLKYPKLASNF